MAQTAPNRRAPRLHAILVTLLGLFFAAPPIHAQESFDWAAVSPVERLMARRAAHLDAMRELGALLQGMPIGGGRQLADLAPELSAFLAGATEQGEPDYSDSGFCRVTLAIPAERILPLVDGLARDRGLPIDIELLQRSVGAQLVATGLGRPRSASRGIPEQPVQPLEPAQPADPGSQPNPRDFAPQPRDERQGALEPGERRFAWSGRAPRRDPDVEAWERQLEQRWRAGEERWESTPHGWRTEDLRDRWQRAQPLGDGWRQLEDGSQVRLIYERIVEQGAYVRRQLEDGSWVDERVDRVIERHYHSR